MFSGIVEEVGQVQKVESTACGSRMKIGAGIVTEGVRLGDSISVMGVCLTVVAFGSDWFSVEATGHTLATTRLGALAQGSRVNLERALTVSGRLGGHLVTGHVDGRGRVLAVRQEGFSRVVSFEVDGGAAPFFVEKGSVAIDGVSLTVAHLDRGSQDRCRFSVALIPHTLAVTTLGELAAGDQVNYEADLIGKYVARWMDPLIQGKLKKEPLGLPFLAEHGYT